MYNVMQTEPWSIQSPGLYMPVSGGNLGSGKRKETVEIAIMVIIRNIIPYHRLKAPHVYHCVRYTLPTPGPCAARAELECDAANLAQCAVCNSVLSTTRKNYP